MSTPIERTGIPLPKSRPRPTLHTPGERMSYTPQSFPCGRSLPLQTQLYISCRIRKDLTSTILPQSSSPLDSLVTPHLLVSQGPERPELGSHTWLNISQLRFPQFFPRLSLYGISPITLLSQPLLFWNSIFISLSLLLLLPYVNSL